MIISKAEVVNIEQISSGFKFKARVESLGNQEKEITYTSPFFSNGNSGLVAIPSVGQSILVVQPQDHQEFFYLGSFVEELPEKTPNPQNIVEDSKNPADRIDDQMYKARGIPQRALLRDPLGNKIVLSNEYNPDYFNVKTEIKSTTGKQIGIVDSPLINSVYVKNDFGDGVTISSGENAVDGARVLKSYAFLGQEHRCSHGRYLIHVLEGRDITIVNNSTGTHKEFGNDLFGNINIESTNKDVNIYSRARNTGKIHIECTDNNATQLVQIKTASNTSVIRISSNGKIELTTGGDLDINVSNDLNLNIGGKLSVNAGGGIDMRSAAAINLDGDTIDLNSGLAAPNSPSIGQANSAYPSKVQT